MGTWGPGNFENDWCAGQLADFCEPLLTKVEEAMDAVDSLEEELPDETIPAYLEIIACLSENLGRHKFGGMYDFLYPCVLPDPNTLAEWKEKFLGACETSIDLYDPTPDHKAQRREVIVDTFDRMLRLSLARCEEGTYPDIRATIRHLMREEGSDDAGG